MIKNHIKITLTLESNISFIEKLKQKNEHEACLSCFDLSAREELQSKDFPAISLYHGPVNLEDFNE